MKPIDMTEGAIQSEIDALEDEAVLMAIKAAQMRARHHMLKTELEYRARFKPSVEAWLSAHKTAFRVRQIRLQHGIR